MALSGETILVMPAIFIAFMTDAVNINRDSGDDMQEINLASHVQQNDAVIYAPVGEELYIMDVEKGEYIGITGVGVRIWALLEAEIPINEVCNRLMEEYQVEKDVCQQETLDFISKLINNRLAVLMKE